VDTTLVRVLDVAADVAADAIVLTVEANPSDLRALLRLANAP
jgi:hypothetical protein